MKKKVVVLGGGLAGLAAAVGLVDKFDVTVIEKQGYLGGLAASVEYKGWLIPQHYHHVFHHDYTTKRYLKEFGLDKNMTWQRIKMKIAVGGKIYEFTNPLGLLKFDYLSLKARLRYGMFGAYVFFLMNPEWIADDLDAETWLKRYAGDEVTSKLFYQLYARNKFGVPLSEISAKQFAHRLKAKEAFGYFGYPIPGLQKLIDGLENKIKKKGGKIIRNFVVKKIDLKAKKVDKQSYDILVNTIPVPEFLALASGLPKDYKDKLARIKYCSVVTVMVGTKGFLGDQYWLNILGEKDVQMLMQHSVLYDSYDTKVSWILRYGGSEKDLGLGDEELKKRYVGTIKKYFPDAEVVWSMVLKDKYASPVYDRTYAKIKPDYETEIDGLYNAGVAVTYPKIRNMNTALESGEKVARLVRTAYGGRG